MSPSLPQITSSAQHQPTTLFSLLCEIRQNIFKHLFQPEQNYDQEVSPWIQFSTNLAMISHLARCLFLFRAMFQIPRFAAVYPIHDVLLDVSYFERTWAKQSVHILVTSLEKENPRAEEEWGEFYRRYPSFWRGYHIVSVGCGKTLPDLEMDGN